MVIGLEQVSLARELSALTNRYREQYPENDVVIAAVSIVALVAASLRHSNPEPFLEFYDIAKEFILENPLAAELTGPDGPLNVRDERSVESVINKAMRN